MVWSCPQGRCAHVVQDFGACLAQPYRVFFHVIFFRWICVLVSRPNDSDPHIVSWFDGRMANWHINEDGAIDVHAVGALRGRRRFLVFRKMEVVPLGAVFLVNVVAGSRLRVRRGLIRIRAMFNPNLCASKAMDSIVNSCRRYFLFPVYFPHRGIRMASVHFQVRGCVNSKSLLF